MSASRHLAARSLVLEWQVVTVAWLHSSRADIGEPTILLRPSTTARDPAMVTPERLMSSRQPLGVQGTKKPSSSP
uniref:Putative secreted protein n=1 Tax=Ixodes ricinus TaxID=34613 RepID=A0A6B0U3R5_IXORI